MSRTVAIWNPASGSAPKEAALRKALGADVELAPTTAEDPGPGQAQAAVDSGAAVVVACGGDGTVRACLSPLAGSSTALGIVPLGTGNLLAGNLGMNTGLKAGPDIGRGPKRRIDIGHVNGEAFAVMAGSGFDALMIRDANAKLKSRLGSIAYVISGAKNLWKDCVDTKVVVDGEPLFEGRSAMVLVGNFGEITGGINVFPDARSDDGKLDVAVVSATGIREWAPLAWRLLRRKPLHVENARRAQGSNIVVDHAEARPYEMDGEDREPTRHLEFTIEPGALTIHQSGPPKAST